MSTSTSTSRSASAPLRVVFDAQGALRDAALECEAAVFLEWFGNTRAQLAEEYGPYEESSVFLVVVDRADTVLGFTRLIVPGPAGLKSLNDMRRDPWRADPAATAAAAGVDPARTWDVATIGVRRGVREQGPAVFEGLLYGITLAVQENDVAAVIALIDDNVRALLDLRGLEMRPFPGTTSGPYLGSPASGPVYSLMSEVWDRQQRVAPEWYENLTLGRGLPGLAVDREQMRLRRVIDVTTAGADHVVDLTGAGDDSAAVSAPDAEPDRRPGASPAP